MNNGILNKEVGEDIDALAEVKPQKDCELGKVVPGILKRALRVGEAGYTSSRRNYWLLLILLLLTIKGDVIATISFLVKLATK